MAFRACELELVMLLFVALVVLLMLALWQPSDVEPQYHDKGGDVVTLLVMLIIGVMAAGMLGLLK
jgi:heme A synthase